MLKKCNRILAFLLALVLVITTFKSDFNGLRVFAGEEDEITVDATEGEGTEKTVEEKLPEIFEEVNEVEEVPAGSIVPVTVLNANEVKLANTNNLLDDSKNELKTEDDADKDVENKEDSDSKPAETEDIQKQNIESDAKKQFQAEVIFSFFDSDLNEKAESKTISWDAEEGETKNYELPSCEEIFGKIEGYNFDGWACGDDVKTESVELTSGQDPVKVVANWTKSTEDEINDVVTSDVNVIVYHKGINDVESEEDRKTVSLGEFAEDVTKKPFTTSSYEEVFGEIEDKTKEFLGWRVAAVGDIEEFELTGENNTLHVEKDGKYDLYAMWGEKEPVVEESTVKVSVYATDGNNYKTPNSAFEPLGLLNVSEDGFYEVGVVELPVTLFTSDSGKYINSSDDFKNVINAVKEAGIDTNALSGSNANNLVLDNISRVASDIGFSATDYKTALADCGGEYKYRLNLRFETVVVTLKGIYYNNAAKEQKVELCKVSLLRYSPFTVADAEAIANKSEYKKDYEFKGLFKDDTLKQTFTGYGSVQNSTNKIVYAQYRKGNEDAICYFLLGKKSGLTYPNEGPQASENYYPVKENNHLKYIWTGTAKDFSQIDPMYIYKEDKGYLSVFNWKGLDTDLVEYTYDSDTVFSPGTSTDTLIDNYVKTVYGDNFDISDVIWYVYKLHEDGKHIDGYVSSFLTYHANLPAEKIKGATEYKDERVRWGTIVSVKDNMFEPVDNDIVFLGWSTDPKATKPDENLESVELNDKKHLYAVWGNKYKLIIKIQSDAEGKDIDTYQMYDGNVYHGGVAVDVSAEITSTNGFSAAVKKITKAVKKAMSLGVLVVYAEEPTTPVDPMQDEEKEVPAKELTVDGMKIKVSGLKTIAKAGLDVGDYPVTLDYSGMKITTIIDGVEVDIKDMFIVEIEGSKVTDEESKSTTIDPANPKDPEIVAYLHVTKRNVTLTSGSATKQYDGTPLTKDGVTVGGDGFANGSIRGQEGATYNVTGSQTAVGSSGNPFTYTLKPENTFAGNYNITVNYGTLTVTPVPGDNPPPDDTPPTITPPGQVLGAVRPVDGAAVLGARRGRTEDSANTLGRIITIIVAAGIGFTMVFIKRKKNEEE